MKNQLLALALMSTAFVSCTDDSYDLDNMSNEIRIGLNEYLPIASSEVKLKDILSEFRTDYIKETAGDPTLKFEFDTTTSVIIKPLDIVFNETSFEYAIYDVATDVIKGNLIPKDQAFPVSAPIKLKINDKNGKGKIKAIHVKKGILKFHFESENVKCSNLYIKTIHIPGVNLDETIKDANGEEVYRFSNDEDTNSIEIILDDLLLQFPEEELMVTCEVGVRGSQDIVLDSKDIKVKVVMEKTSLSYHKIVGSFNSNVEQIERTNFYINLYDDNLDPKLKVIDPSFTITGSTNSGIPLYCGLNHLVGKHKNKDKSPSKDSVVLMFNKGIMAGDVSLETDHKEFAFNCAQNEKEEVVAFNEIFDNAHIRCNLDEVFSYLPDSVSVACGIRINADTASGVDYFLLDSTYLDLHIHASIPLHIGDSSSLTIRDTVTGIDIAKEITDYQNGQFLLDQAEVYVEIENGLPLEALVTAHFCKADTASDGTVKLTRINNKKLDQTVRVPACEISNGGFFTKAKSSLTKISVSEDMVDDIKKINAVDFTYKIKVPEGAVNGVFLTSDCSMAAKVYSHLKANISNKTEK